MERELSRNDCASGAASARRSPLSRSPIGGLSAPACDHLAKGLLRANRVGARLCGRARDRVQFLAPSGLRGWSARATCHIVTARLEADATPTAFARTDYPGNAGRGRITYWMGAGRIDRVC